MFYSFFACKFFEYGVFVTNAFRTSGLWHVCELPTMGSVLFVFTPFMALLFTLVVFYVIGNKSLFTQRGDNSLFPESKNERA